MAMIFVVEDEEKLADVLEKYIKAEGYEVMTFNKGGEVVEAAHQHNPELILLDLSLIHI